MPATPQRRVATPGRNHHVRNRNMPVLNTCHNEPLGQSCMSALSCDELCIAQNLGDADNCGRACMAAATAQTQTAAVRASSTSVREHPDVTRKPEVARSIVNHIEQRGRGGTLQRAFNVKQRDASVYPMLRPTYQLAKHIRDPCPPMDAMRNAGASGRNPMVGTIAGAHFLLDAAARAGENPLTSRFMPVLGRA